MNFKKLKEGDIVKIGQLKGHYIVVWDEDFKILRLKSEFSNSGFAFENVRYRIKIVEPKQLPPIDNELK